LNREGKEAQRSLTKEISFRRFFSFFK